MGTGIDFAHDQELIETVDNDLNGSMTWDGTAYTCRISPISSSYATDTIAGYMDDATITVRVRQTLFTSSTPSRGDTVTISGDTYRIQRIDTDPANSVYLIEIVEETG